MYAASFGELFSPGLLMTTLLVLHAAQAAANSAQNIATLKSLRELKTSRDMLLPSAVISEWESSESTMLLCCL